jgi:hypothetical protein
MLYTKFVRTNRTWHEYAREARAQGTAHRRVRTRTRHAQTSCRFTHDYARIGTARTAAAHGHSRRAQVTVAGHGKVITICDKLGSTQSQVAGTRIQHTNTNRTNTDTNRTGRITNRTGAGTNRTDTHTNRTATMPRLQGTGAGGRSSREQEQGQEQAYGTGHGSRRGGHDTARHVATRHDSATRHDTIRYRYIRYDTIRYTRDARDRQQVTHTIRM